MTSYLLSLPNELLLSAFKHLAPEPLAIGSSPKLSRHYIQRRGTLRELYPVSRGVSQTPGGRRPRQPLPLSSPTYFLFREFGGVTRLDYHRDAAGWNEVLCHLDDGGPADNQALKKNTMAKTVHRIEELRFYSSRTAR
ncbi:hypothetical protein DL766_007518 [Monosporascus sp. MC13-8B]|nr:hypothetical protein DL763_000954 [Monosporascus cannonballus]RYP23450.1 hypothetical protein DL766_007518 [Monosporascus sp. MC13-8B]